MWRWSRELLAPGRTWWRPREAGAASCCAICSPRRAVSPRSSRSPPRRARPTRSLTPTGAISSKSTTPCLRSRRGSATRSLTAGREKAPFANVAVIAGGLPPGAPPDLHARLVSRARECGAFTILDSSSPDALELALGAGPDLVKPNLAELSLLLGAGVVRGGDAPLGALSCVRRAAPRARRGCRVAQPRAARLPAGERRRGAALQRSRRQGGELGRMWRCARGGSRRGLARGLDLPEAAALGVAAAADKLGRLHSGRGGARRRRARCSHRWSERRSPPRGGGP